MVKSVADDTSFSKGWEDKMPLKFYKIDTTLFHPNCWAMLKDTSFHKEVFSFFIMNLGDEETISKIKLEFVADKGYTPKNIVKTDHIMTGSTLLFSKRFVDRVGEILKNEMQFYPCTLICKGIEFEWFAARITHFYPIVDKKLSTYHFSVGKERVKDAKYRTDIDEQFYIAWDSEESSPFVVSDLFKKLCEENGLLMNFRLCE